MEKNVSRKKFIAWAVGLGSVAVLVPPFFKSSSKKRSKSTTTRMLTQDGKLVEVDIANIPAKKRKLGLADIHGWIRKKTSM
ncbi:MAG: hypothetical protein ACXVBH_10155 [Flavisolibacter sp.]